MGVSGGRTESAVIQAELTRGEGGGQECVGEDLKVKVIYHSGDQSHRHCRLCTDLITQRVLKGEVIKHCESVRGRGLGG